MAITAPTYINFLYRFETGTGRVYAFTGVAEEQVYNDEVYSPVEITHEPPTFSEEPQDAEIDVTVKDTNAVADLFVANPPPYSVKLRIYEYDRTAGTVTDYYRGWVVRPNFALDKSTVDLHCKTMWHFFDKESLSDSLSMLSRYSIFDPRSGVDVEPLRVAITVDALNDERDVLTVSGITQPDDWFKGGIVVAPDRDARTILQHVTESGLKKLYLSGAFPRFTLDIGFPADIYPGDDLTYETWANKYQAETNFGEKWGGWQYMPNVDPAERGVI